MSIPPRPTGESVLHERLLNRDKAAPADVYKTFADRIIKVLRYDYPWCEKDMAHDAMIDAIMVYLKAPDKYDVGKGALFSYLIQVAKNKLVDRKKSLDASQKRDQKFFESRVEDPGRNPKEEMEDFVEAKRLLTRFLASGKLKSAREVEHLRLLLCGEGSTQLVASTLGFEPMSWEKLQQEVKRQRDRILKALERFGKDGDRP
jgi:RNA polymerase sigma-70 factor, ECF subfamily